MYISVVGTIPNTSYLRGSGVSAGFRESPQSHLQHDRTPSASYPRGFRKLCDGLMHVRMYVLHNP